MLYLNIYCNDIDVPYLFLSYFIYDFNFTNGLLVVWFSHMNDIIYNITF